MFDSSEYAIIEPDPNVIPRINCGATKNLFVSGYKIIKKAKNIESFIVREFVSNNRSKRDRMLKTKKNNHASIKEIEPTERGLFNVLLTSLSIL